MAHAHKPDFVFRRNGRVHLNRWGRHFSRLLAAEVCASAVVMLNTPCSEVVWRVLATHSTRQFPFTSPPVRYRVPSHFIFNVCHPEVFKTCINIQCCVSQTQQKFIMFIIVLGQHVSILTESSSGPSKKIDSYLKCFKMRYGIPNAYILDKTVYKMHVSFCLRLYYKSKMTHAFYI